MPKTFKLLRNAVRCKICNDIIESKSRHDFKRCKCGGCFVDGGLDYCRRGGDLSKIEDLAEWETTGNEV